MGDKQNGRQCLRPTRELNGRASKVSVIHTEINFIEKEKNLTSKATKMHTLFVTDRTFKEYFEGKIQTHFKKANCKPSLPTTIKT